MYRMKKKQFVRVDAWVGVCVGARVCECLYEKKKVKTLIEKFRDLDSLRQVPKQAP